MNGDVDRVRMLLGQRNHNPNVSYCTTPPLLFFWYTHITLTCAQAQARDESGYTALHYACRNGKLEVCKLLVAKGASVNVRVSVFAWRATPHSLFFCLLVKPYDALNAFACFVLHNASMFANSQVSLTHLSFFMFLLFPFFWFLHLFAHRQSLVLHLCIVQVIIQLRTFPPLLLPVVFVAVLLVFFSYPCSCIFNCAMLNIFVVTLFPISAFCGHDDVIRFLLENGADASLQDDDGKFSDLLALMAYLFVLVLCFYLFLFVYLLGYWHVSLTHYPLTVYMHIGMTALHKAAEQGKINAIKLLLQRWVCWRPLCAANVPYFRLFFWQFAVDVQSYWIFLAFFLVFFLLFSNGNAKDISDNKGKRAADYATTPEMKQMLL